MASYRKISASSAASALAACTSKRRAGAWRLSASSWRSRFGIECPLVDGVAVRDGRLVFQASHLVGRHPARLAGAAQCDAVTLEAGLGVAPLQRRGVVVNEVA